MEEGRAKKRKEAFAQEVLKTITKNADKVAKRYKRRCWWADVEDLRQEAIVQQLDAWRRFDVSQGVALEGYLFRVAVYAARRALLKASAPVSASHRLDVLVGLYRAPVQEDSAGIAKDAEHAFFARQVEDRLVRCLGADRAAFTISMIVEGWSVREVAEANNVTSKDVTQELARAQGMMRADSTLHLLWREGA